jgi:hypothetical protein
MLQFLNPNTPKSISCRPDSNFEFVELWEDGISQDKQLRCEGYQLHKKYKRIGTFRAKVVRSGKLLAITSLLPF